MRISDCSSDVCSSDLLGLELLPPVAERPHRQRVDPGPEAGGDDEGLDTERAAQRFVLVLDVAGDQGAVAERHHPGAEPLGGAGRSEEHTSELPSLMRISYAVFCLKKKT